jgi:hypothetical protein
MKQMTIIIDLTYNPTLAALALLFTLLLAVLVPTLFVLDLLIQHVRSRRDAARVRRAHLRGEPMP